MNLRTRRLSYLPLVIVLLVLVLAAVEAYRGYRFYHDLNGSKQTLLSLKADLAVSGLEQSDSDLTAKQQRLRRAQRDLAAAHGFLNSDPLVFVAAHLPVIGKQTRGLEQLTAAGQEATDDGLQALDVALAFAHYNRASDQTSIEGALSFLTSQTSAMAGVEDGLHRLQDRRAAIPDGLWGPLGSATADLDSALSKLQALVQGYDRANALLPEVLGMNGPRRYLILPQNDTELFPSGGLISSYGIATFDQGRIADIQLEYFGTLFDRWQAQTHEYVEPPAPLKNYLLHNFSWGLGEAGWYPDFPTTAGLAQSFVQKGGAPATDGTIAIDLKFTKALLALLGPVSVPSYGVTVDADNIEETTLELTRNDNYVPNQPPKAFLSSLAQAILSEVLSAPKDRWIDLLQLLDQEAKERHLQLNFVDPQLQALSGEYGLDGSIVQSPNSDYLLIADTSVNSTKLNLILQPQASVQVALLPNGHARYLVSYQISNPFDQWKVGRDPSLVSQLMLGGVYGCYLRLYTPPGSMLQDVRLDGQSVGAEQNGSELGKTVFGRFFPVVPGATDTVQFLYETPNAVTVDASGQAHYSLYIQKEAGTGATPLHVQVQPPANATVTQSTLDGAPTLLDSLMTDLQVDRQLSLAYSLPQP